MKQKLIFSTVLSFVVILTSSFLIVHTRTFPIKKLMQNDEFNESSDKNTVLQEINLEFYQDGRPLMVQVEVDVYHSMTSPVDHFQTSRGQQKINIDPDYDSIVVTSAIYKEIVIGLSKAKDLKSIVLHFYKANAHDELESIRGHVYKQPFSTISTFENLLVELYTHSRYDSVYTGDGGLLQWEKGFYRFTNLDENYKSATLNFNKYTGLRMHNINDDVEIDVVLDGTIPIFGRE